MADGSLSVSTNATGRFTSTVYNPIGPVVAADATFRNDVYIRFGANGGAGARATIQTGATNISNVRNNAGTEANSTFTNGNLNYVLTQTVTPTFDVNNVLTGSLLTQTYRITNTGGANSQFELVRYYDGDLRFDGSLIDGGGRLVTAGGDEVLFETDIGGGGSTATTFVGLTGRGGTIPTVGRYRIDSFGVMSGGVPNGLPMTDNIVGDTDLDGFINPGSEYDVTLNIRNVYDIPAGGNAIYTTHTIFGNGLPNQVGTVPPVVNVVPTVANDSVTGTSINGSSLFVDVVSNDVDPDGAIVFNTIVITTQPTNGTAVSLGNGLIQYTPNIGFSGVDTLTYTIADNAGGVSARATVTFNVTQVVADSADDTLVGSEGDDTIVGSDGDDLITGSAGGDVVDGGIGNDTVFGGAGNDSIDGGSGNDSLTGNAGNDTLNGGADDDTLVWRGTTDGSDSISDENGYDSVVVFGSSGDDVFSIQGTGTDLAIVQGLATLAVDASIRDVRINGSRGNDTFTIGDITSIGLSSLTINGDAGIDFLNGTNSGASNVLLFLNGGADNDGLRGGAGVDFINGNDGSDVILGRAGNDSINGGAGDDSIDAGDGNDFFDGGDGNDTIVGGAGDDFGTGGNDNDSVNGQDGNDSLLGGMGGDTLIGEAGNDSVSGELGSDVLIGGSGSDTLDGGRNDDTISGNSGNDLIRGDHGADSINGGAGDDTINAGDGDDIVIGGDGFDLIDAGDGNDFVSGGSQSDTIVGGDGNDTLTGGGASDVLLGEQGDDVLRGGVGGSDTGSGGEGADDVTSVLASIEIVDEDFELATNLRAALNL